MYIKQKPVWKLAIKQEPAYLSLWEEENNMWHRKIKVFIAMLGNVYTILWQVQFHNFDMMDEYWYNNYILEWRKFKGFWSILTTLLRCRETSVFVITGLKLNGKILLCIFSFLYLEWLLMLHFCRNPRTLDLLCYILLLTNKKCKMYFHVHF